MSKKSLFSLSIAAVVLSFMGAGTTVNARSARPGEPISQNAYSIGKISSKVGTKTNFMDPHFTVLTQAPKTTQIQNESNNSSKDQSKPAQKPSSSNSSQASDKSTGASVTAAQMQADGVEFLNGNKWTYYSGAAFADGTTNHNGKDADGYIIVAAPMNVPFGTHIETPLGMGCVHDRGTAIVGINREEYNQWSNNNPDNVGPNI